MGSLKRRRLLLAALLCTGGLSGALGNAASAQAADTGAAIGTPAPGFRLPALAAGNSGSSAVGDAAGSASRSTGVERSLAEFAGKVVWLDFWASWCGPCRQSFPWMNAMQARLGDRGLRVIAVSLDRREADALRFLEQTPARFLVLHDAAATTPVRYGVAGMPTSVLIGRDGRVLARHSGFTASSAARLEPLIERALDARP